MSDEKLLSGLKSLALTIKKRVDEGISNLSTKPREEEYFRWKAENFRYTDQGPDYSASGEYFGKPSWFLAVRKLTEVVKQSGEYAFALEQVTARFGKSEGFSSFLDYFIVEITNQCLRSPTIKETDLDLLIATFLKDLLEEPVRYGANVELQGIVLHPESIEPSYGITLRKTKKEDVEKEFAVYGLMPYRGFLPRPSAMMRIEFLGRHANEVQKRVGKAIAILRLFKVGSVEFISSKMFSESIIDKALGTVTSGKARRALETYLVTDTDVQKLKEFWQTMNDSLPESFFWADVTSVDYLTIAYNRYSDALMENGLLERRIANAVMGLEALVLTGETQELSYRLGIRISKLLSLLGHDPHKVKKAINDAYKVRSLFAHGGQLSYRRKEMLESRYGEAKNLLLSVLDYLRTLIIVMKLSRKGKDEFIDLVDDSLVDKKREERLNNIISQAKEVCTVS